MDKYFVISPDNLPTTPEAMPLDRTFDEVARFCKSYIGQGYYSSTEYSRIPVPDLLDMIRIVPANKDGGCFESL